MNTLFLHLEGVLQAWGEESRYMVRNTAPLPTKSGVIGLLAQALGDPEAAPALSNALRMGVKVLKPGTLLEDYHTVTGGTRAARGDIRPETLITYRYYLADAAFRVALQGHPSLLSTLVAALRAPQKPLFLGRRCCPPSVPIFERVDDYPDLRSALAPLDGLTEIEVEPSLGGIYRMDAVRDVQAHTFAARYVQLFQAEG